MLSVRSDTPVAPQAVQLEGFGTQPAAAAGSLGR
jgi:hypothetical protein